MSFAQYASGKGRASIMHGVPVSMLDAVLVAFKAEGRKVKIRYRGPRAHRYANHVSKKRFYNLDIINAHSTCLKADATTFAVYRRD